MKELEQENVRLRRAVTPAVAAVEHAAAAAPLQGAQGGDMGVGEIGNMKIVAHAGAVLRIVVRSE